MKKIYIVLLLVTAYQLTTFAAAKTIIVRNRSNGVVTISAQDFQGKVYSGQLTCDADNIRTIIPSAQFKITIDVPAKTWTELVTGRTYFKSVTINKVSLLPADLAEMNKHIASLIDKNDTVTVYLHKRTAPESWGDWGKNYAKETLNSYLGKSSTPPVSPYDLTFVKEDGTKN